MVTKVKAYSSWRAAPSLPFVEGGKPSTDLIQILNVDGLDPVKASINTQSYGSVDGASFTGADIVSRNIVLTLGINPDWASSTPATIRRQIYSYFMPKQPVRLVFESDDISPVEISGYVESVSHNMFSKDLEVQVSIICPKPYFQAVEATVFAGQTIRSSGDPVIVEYNGNIEVGFNLEVSYVSGTNPTEIAVKIGTPALTYFMVDATVDNTKYFELNTVPLEKYVQNVYLSDGHTDNLLAYTHIIDGTTWPFLQPGNNDFSVITDAGVQDWQLKYYERYGGI